MFRELQGYGRPAGFAGMGTVGTGTGQGFRTRGWYFPSKQTDLVSQPVKEGLDSLPCALAHS